MKLKIELKNMQLVSDTYFGINIAAKQKFLINDELERFTLGNKQKILDHIDNGNLQVWINDIHIIDKDSAKLFLQTTATAIYFHKEQSILSEDISQLSIEQAARTPVENSGQSVGFNIGPRTINFGYGLQVTKENDYKAKVDVNVDDIWTSFSFTEVSDEEEESTTSTEWQNKLTMNLTNIPAGKYRIGSYWEWQHNSPSSEFIGQVIVDDTTEIAYQRDELSDASDHVWCPTTTFKYIDLSAGDHTIKINWKSDRTKKVATIRRARLEVWKVS